jgi:hypothetical protein
MKPVDLREVLMDSDKFQHTSELTLPVNNGGETCKKGLVSERIFVCDKNVELIRAIKNLMKEENERIHSESLTLFVPEL